MLRRSCNRNTEKHKRNTNCTILTSEKNHAANKRHINHTPLRGKTQNRYSMPFQRQYLTKHNQWKNEFKTIDWSTIKSTYNDVSFYTKIIFTKLVNKILPLNYCQHKKKLYVTPKCPCCDHLETDQYLLHCQYKLRKEHSSAFRKTLTETMQKQNIDPYLQIIAHYFRATDIQHKIPEKTKYTNILKTQLQIGPQSLHYRLVSLDWIKQQITYRETIGLPNDKNQAFSRIKAMTTLFWEYTKQTWLLRNAQLHKTTLVIMNFKRTQLNEDIANLYDKENEMMYDNRVIFSKTLKIRKKFNTLMQLEQFHKMAKLIQRRSIEGVKMFG